MRLTFTYWPAWRIEPLMSMTTTVAHLGQLRVRWIWMSSGLMRTGRPGPWRNMALIRVWGMSMCVSESPNSYGLVCCISTAPSPTMGP